MRNRSASGNRFSSGLVHKHVETHRKRRSVHSRPFSMFTASSGSSVPRTRCISGWTLSEESLSLVFSVGYVTIIHVAAESPRPSRTCRCRWPVAHKASTTLSVCGLNCDAGACACVCVCLYFCSPAFLPLPLPLPPLPLPLPVVVVWILLWLWPQPCSSRSLHQCFCIGDDFSAMHGKVEFGESRLR